MKFKIGDTVRFLNEKGGGIVSSIPGKNEVIVKIEDGFEIPVHVNDIVLIGEEKAGEAAAVISTPSEPVKQQPVIKGEAGLYFILSPAEIAIIPTAFKIYIANNTLYDVMYSFCIQKSGNDEGLNMGIAEAGKNVYLQEVSKAEIESWDSIVVRMLFHKNGLCTHASTGEHRFVIRGASLSLSNMKKNILLDESAYAVLLGNPKSGSTFMDDFVNQSKHSVKTTQKESVPVGAKHFRLNTFNNHLEVDLHIEELIENIGDLSNAEIIRIQLQKFQLALDHAIAQHMKRVYFIHGVGNGTLKREIRNILDTYYDVSYTDAPSKYYGAGATEVNLK